MQYYNNLVDYIFAVFRCWQPCALLLNQLKSESFMVLFIFIHCDCVLVLTGHPPDTDNGHAGQCGARSPALR